jgi:hypothetical protein
MLTARVQKSAANAVKHYAAKFAFKSKAGILYLIKYGID